MMTMVLQKAGFETETAKTGTEALQKARESKPALVFLDAVLPDIDGFEVARTLKQDPSPVPSPYIVLLTGLEDVTRESLEASGIDEVMRKPFQPERVVDIVKRVLAS